MPVLPLFDRLRSRHCPRSDFDLFEDARPEALIERAYDLQSDRIAYVEKDPLEE